MTTGRLHRRDDDRRKRNERVSFDSETKGFYRSIGIKDDMRSLPYQPWSKAQVERFLAR
ncbi:hypothetical protein WJ0W_007106 [Paenibacillus melissococcoides]|uniref:Uncharacterized protein n=1 Tax=Paenibacillus melissococcoides TaxID=2912268 RepID=A0ABM9GDG8_9BACL|nr:hypothetical protein WJ0W_007106 [Paenibacillus melissococcoides]